jgi:hypothetical protein
MAATSSADSRLARNPLNLGEERAGLSTGGIMEKAGIQVDKADRSQTRRPRLLGEPRPELRYPPGMRMTLGA